MSISSTLTSAFKATGKAALSSAFPEVYAAGSKWRSVYNTHVDRHEVQSSKDAAQVLANRVVETNSLLSTSLEIMMQQNLLLKNILDVLMAEKPWAEKIFPDVIAARRAGGGKYRDKNGKIHETERNPKTKQWTDKFSKAPPPKPINESEVHANVEDAKESGGGRYRDKAGRLQEVKQNPKTGKWANKRVAEPKPVETPVEAPKPIPAPAAPVVKPGFFSKLSHVSVRGAGLYFNVLAVYEAAKQIMALDTNDPDYREKVTVIVGQIVARYGLAWGGGILFGFIGGMFGFGVGAIPGFVLGLAGGTAAQYMFGGTTDELVELIIHKMFEKKPPKNIQQQANGNQARALPNVLDKQKLTVLTYKAADLIKFKARELIITARSIKDNSIRTDSSGSYSGVAEKVLSSVLPPPAPGDQSDVSDAGNAAGEKLKGGPPPTAAGNFGGLDWAAGVDHRVHKDILEKVKQVQELSGVHFVATSGYRDPGRNAAAGGAKNSAHMRRNAIDVKFAGDSDLTNKVIEAASKAGIGGIGVYQPGSLHFDTESRRSWGPNYHSTSIPGWAAKSTRAHMNNKYDQYESGTPYVPETGPAIIHNNELRITGDRIEKLTADSGGTLMNLMKGDAIVPSAMAEKIDTEDPNSIFYDPWTPRHIADRQNKRALEDLAAMGKMSPEERHKALGPQDSEFGSLGPAYNGQGWKIEGKKTNWAFEAPPPAKITLPQYAGSGYDDFTTNYRLSDNIEDRRDEPVPPVFPTQQTAVKGNDLEEDYDHENSLELLHEMSQAHQADHQGW